MEDADFNVTFGSSVYLVKQISNNHFKLKGSSGEFYIFKRKGKWTLNDHGYYFTHKKFIDRFLKNKDDWIIETLLLGEME